MNDEHHISSLVVLHRPDAIDALKDFTARQDAMELAIQGECRCVMLCETPSQRAVLEHIEAMEALPGVINVSLIYHHVESQDVMNEPVTLGASLQGANV